MAEFNYYYFKNYFNDSKIKEINDFIENNFDDFEEVIHGAKNDDGSFKKNSSVKIISWKKIKHFFSELESKLYLANQRHFGYDLYNMNDNVFVLLNTYDSKDKGSYDWHRDASRSNVFDTKLTVLINLSTENYEGGQFELNTGNAEIIKQFNEPGDVLMFQSLILHKVNPVTKGIRKTLAFFLNGPSFR